ncbi:electron transport complex subunit RsxG [Pseudoalteromonas peptidolytica]|uniref:Ion-translocating oxidoreductase complex subunit G n=1 Tax=Pseudoalteromonas peptidolytica F12-50-A1 TaxID=1315280 RepID=A0A8I0MT40_9GAMM|nr:electron transport complex subunit RsxG [Pseudoalteromonas peptidolytica]MBE0345322.1 electron transport complex protein RnfG [Pseudoalteromonas peptidolytica F12-50-A1]NLR15872.1 electron transport complex subunit RsxG [Pseudoalteromonas peptidolytica]GEK11580.1 electron transport complex subunit G [Pseudoalteromonas peptidolytica]
MIIQSMQKNGLILAAFALATTGAVALINDITKDKIANQEQQHLMQLLSQVIAKDQYDNTLYLDCTTSNAPELGPQGPHTIYRARLNGAPSALLVRHITPRGYSGNIDILTAVNREGVISGVRITRHEETPGLGDKVELAKSAWVTTFNGVNVTSEADPHLNVKKDGGQFDAFTGATITPRAVVTSVNQAAWFAKTHFDALFDAKNTCEVSQ